MNEPLIRTVEVDRHMARVLRRLLADPAAWLTPDEVVGRPSSRTRRLLARTGCRLALVRLRSAGWVEAGTVRGVAVLRLYSDAVPLAREHMDGYRSRWGWLGEVVAEGAVAGLITRLFD